MAMPVGMSCRSPAASVTGWSMQAHRSMHAAPAVAKRGRGMSVPILGDRALIFNSIETPFSAKNKNYPYNMAAVIRNVYSTPR